MKIYSIERDKQDYTILHFGLGLIGSAIRDQFLKKQGEFLVEQTLNFTWNVNTLASELNHIFSVVHNRSNITIIWSGGKVGFSASDVDVQEEFNLFNKFVSYISKQDLINNMHFILLSSAGGLFEGQRNIDADSLPNPLRPYGKLKLAQENTLIEQLNGFAKISILRPSSVYSHVVHKNRIGLIQLIIKKALQREVIDIYANQSTKRDYILDQDIGRFTADITLLPPRRNINKYFMVSGKAYSIFEVLKIVETQLMNPVYVRFAIDTSNSEDITFNIHPFNQGLIVTPLELSIKKMIIFNLDRSVVS